MLEKRQLRLNNVKNIRSSIGAVIRDYVRQGDQADGYFFRTLATLLDLLLKAHSQEKLNEFDERITRIESYLEDYQFDSKQAKGN